MDTPEKIRDALAYATGTENYWSIYHGNRILAITDGVKVMADMCEAWWLLDKIYAEWASTPKLREEAFLVWRLTLDGTTAQLIGDDGNGNELFRQKISHTDFPLPEGIKLYLDNNVLMLPSEY